MISNITENCVPHCRESQTFMCDLSLHHWKFVLRQTQNADCRGHDLHNLGKTARSPSTVTACQLAQQSNETPSCSRDIEDGLWGEQMGGSPKASTTASGRGNQPAGSDPESNRGCPGPHDIKRDGHNQLETPVKTALSISSWAKVQSQQRSSLTLG